MAVVVGKRVTLCWVVFFSVLLFEYILTHFSTLNYELGHYRDVFLAAIIFFLALFYHSTH